MSSASEAIRVFSLEVVWEGLHTLLFLLLLFVNSALSVKEDDKYKALNGLFWFFSPHSVLSEDQDSYLCNVTLFRKAVDDFRHKARENK